MRVYKFFYHSTSEYVVCERVFYLHTLFYFFLFLQTYILHIHARKCNGKSICECASISVFLFWIFFYEKEREKIHLAFSDSGCHTNFELEKFHVNFPYNTHKDTYIFICMHLIYLSTNRKFEYCSEELFRYSKVGRERETEYMHIGFLA